MPTITYNKKDLKNLIKKEMSDEQLEEVIGLIKPNVEKVDENEIVVEHTADRPDMFGVEGLARAINNYLSIGGFEKYSLIKQSASIKVESVPVRPYIASAIVRGVKMNDSMLRSIMNIQEVLHESIGRKRRKVAIGMHDLDKIKGKISYLGVSREEKMTALDTKEEMTLKDVLGKTEKGSKYAHLIKDSRLWPVFKDSKGIFSFPPILNSERTKVEEKTKNIFIEVTGIDKEAVSQTLNILVTNFIERKYKVEPVKLKFKAKSETTPNLREDVVEVDKAMVNKLLGLDLKSSEMENLLKRMGFKTVDAKEKIEVIIPPYRSDILHQVDIIEDIAISYGYNNLLPKISNVGTIGTADQMEKICEKARMILVGYGFQEVMRFVLSNEYDQFKKMEIDIPRDFVAIDNPVSEEYTIMRKFIRPGLLRILMSNQHVEYPQNIFEIGDVVMKNEESETGTATIRKISAIVCHSKAGFAEIKSVLEGLMSGLGIEYRLSNGGPDDMIEGRRSIIISEGKVIGEVGEIHPRVLENWRLEMPVAALEIKIENL